MINQIIREHSQSVESVPYDNIPEIWNEISKEINCIVVKAGATHDRNNNQGNDWQCVDLMREFIFVQKILSEQPRPSPSEEGILVTNRME